AGRAALLLHKPREVAPADPKPLLHPLLGALVFGILVFDGERPVVADLAKRGDEGRPVDPSAARHPVPPPPRMPRIVAELLAQHAVAILALQQDPGILRVRVEDATGVVPRGSQVIDAEP